MGKFFERAVILVGVFAFLAFSVSCVAWEWNECRGVGHGVLYCIAKQGR